MVQELKISLLGLLGWTLWLQQLEHHLTDELLLTEEGQYRWDCPPLFLSFLLQLVQASLDVFLTYCSLFWPGFQYFLVPLYVLFDPQSDLHLFEAYSACLAALPNIFL
jgi:hypothetical protein